jgi:ferredoxin
MAPMQDALWVMANRNEKNPGNSAGPFYIDASCIDCDLCRETAPATFRRNDEIGQSIAYRQPATVDEIAIATQAMIDCPTESIGNDGE